MGMAGASQELVEVTGAAATSAALCAMAARRVGKPAWRRLLCDMAAERRRIVQDFAPLLGTLWLSDVASQGGRGECVQHDHFQDLVDAIEASDERLAEGLRGTISPRPHKDTAVSSRPSTICGCTCAWTQRISGLRESTSLAAMQRNWHSGPLGTRHAHANSFCMK